MTSPWQHIPSMRIISQNEVSDTPSMRRTRTHPPLRNCRDNAKLACHCTSRYKVEWIYTQTKMRGQGSLELVLIMKKKERKKEERMRNGLYFKHLILACTIVLMNDLGLAR